MYFVTGRVYACCLRGTVWSFDSVTTFWCSNTGGLHRWFIWLSDPSHFRFVLVDPGLNLFLKNRPATIHNLLCTDTGIWILQGVYLVRLHQPLQEVCLVHLLRLLLVASLGNRLLLLQVGYLGNRLPLPLVASLVNRLQQLLAVYLVHNLQRLQEACLVLQLLLRHLHFSTVLHQQPLVRPQNTSWTEKGPHLYLTLHLFVIHLLQFKNI